MAKKTELQYKIGYLWDDYKADYTYYLMLDTGSSFKDAVEIADGDKAWAERTAKHYNIDMPVTPEEKEAAAKPVAAPFFTPGRPVPTPHVIHTPSMPMPFTTTTGSPNLPSSATGQVYTPQPDMGKFTPHTTIAEAK